MRLRKAGRMERTYLRVFPTANAERVEDATSPPFCLIMMVKKEEGNGKIVT